MPRGHYTLVDSLARIFGSDSKNELLILTRERGYELLIPLIHEIPCKIHIDYVSGNSLTHNILEKISDFQPDRIYIVTLEKNFLEFIRLKFPCQVNLFIHNIDDWFRLTPSILIYRFFAGLRMTGSFFYYIKTCFVYPFFKKWIKKKVLTSGGKFVVLNKYLKNELGLYTPIKNIDVIPFSVYNHKIRNVSLNTGLIRFCIPGMLDTMRRDYFSLFNILEENLDFLKNRIELDLLGSINHKMGGGKIINEAEKLIKKGLKINYYTKSFIPMAEFDKELAKAHFILGNMNLRIHKYSSYGITKDSGIIFTMIRVAKPGLLPEKYLLIDELKSSTLLFKDYGDLANIIKRIVIEPLLLDQLTVAAEKNSLLFEPSVVLKTLV